MPSINSLWLTLKLTHHKRLIFMKEYTLLPCQNLEYTLSTIQLESQQFSQRFLWVFSPKQHQVTSLQAIYHIFCSSLWVCPQKSGTPVDRLWCVTFVELPFSLKSTSVMPSLLTGASVSCAAIYLSEVSDSVIYNIPLWSVYIYTTPLAVFFVLKTSLQSFK